MTISLKLGLSRASSWRQHAWMRAHTRGTPFSRASVGCGRQPVAAANVETPRKAACAKPGLLQAHSKTTMAKEYLKGRKNQTHGGHSSISLLRLLLKWRACAEGHRLNSFSLARLPMCCSVGWLALRAPVSSRSSEKSVMPAAKSGRKANCKFFLRTHQILIKEHRILEYL